MNFPENLKYTKDHEWILAEGKTGTVGITEHAQGELGDVVFVELPSVGKSLKQHDSFGTIEAVKAVSDLYAPVAGTVAEVNEDLAAAPEAVNKDPYGKGWMIKITIVNPQELASLMDAATYRKLIGK
jgi:glycine cleavage system H protein